MDHGKVVVQFDSMLDLTPDLGFAVLSLPVGWYGTQLLPAPVSPNRSSFEVARSYFWIDHPAHLPLGVTVEYWSVFSDDVQRGRFGLRR